MSRSAGRRVVSSDGYDHRIPLAASASSPLTRRRYASVDLGSDNTLLYPFQVVPKHRYIAVDGAVDWQCATHGVRVLALAMDEESNPNPITEEKRQRISRKLYIDAMTYLLQALPQDLSKDERASISKSMPTDGAATTTKTTKLTCSEPAKKRSFMDLLIALWFLCPVMIMRLLLPVYCALAGRALTYWKWATLMGWIRVSVSQVIDDTDTVRGMGSRVGHAHLIESLKNVIAEGVKDLL